MSKKTVLITNADVPESAIKLLSRYNLIVNDDYSKNGILTKVPGVDAIFWANKIKLDNHILDAAGPQLQIVATMSVGVDKFNIDELKKRGIKLTNTPEVLSATVAELAVMLLVAAARRLHEGRLKMESNQWPGDSTSQWMLGHDIKGSIVGIVGLGKVGQSIVNRLKCFDVAKFIYSGHSEKEEGRKLGAQFVTLDSLLRESDFVVVCVPLTNETKDMFNEDAFNKMKRTAVFVNISRGEVVNQSALIKVLKNGTIFAAGLDVMIPEPIPSDSELLTLANCVITPHLGSSTLKTRTAMAELTAKNIIHCLEGKELLTPVY